ncbi:hypothetical protein GCM10008956_24370 [Deinococcus arenae]|uniref:WD40 repeat domain-containing protein n=1 Tax=Deinococcus arenae TaxID=1452751 RepID=A0A8H9L9E5_9DEIO|nr:hypothetical protein [Deinococcus arenae]AWT34880.1 hypothetical protein DM785_04370 [Deinococcus actinosclerus]GGM47292.1 hypothetical protein GCM10008956_24370 [Deinococcus arenae]
MLTLLAAAVLVPFGARGEVTVPFPSGDVPSRAEATVHSPRGDAAAVKLCPKVFLMGPELCQVVLARPGRSPLTLKAGVVGHLLWTPDGQYLIGAGVTTLRLWNLSGGLRLAVPQGIPEADGAIRDARLTRLWLERGFLCAALHEDWFTDSGRVVRRNVTTVRYALPTLRPLASVTLPAQGDREADCFRPSAESGVQVP